MLLLKGKSWEADAKCMKSSGVWVLGFFCLMMSGSLFFFWVWLNLSSQDWSGCVVVSVNLFSSGLMELSLPFLMDWISLSFGGAVCFISSWVLVYSRFYMENDAFLLRFLMLVSLFVFSMNLLIFSPSVFTMMIGWDGLGVVSFILVVYYLNSESYSAGMITVFSNRVGDVFFIIMIAFTCCCLDFSFFGGIIDLEDVVWVLGGCVLLGSITKSAQLPFCAWLPAAMAAPTPVSTLVHSSTLVTAGVYTIIRFGFLMSGDMKMCLLVISVVTFFLASVSGIYEVDMKKVVALSTLSQVSMMMVALSLGFCALSLFHLLVHAFFKALMFMCVGSVIACSGGVQDIRLLSGFWKKLPLSMMWYCVSVGCLCGLPFLSGFFSKDLIVEKLMSSSSGVVVFFLCLLSVTLTVWYSSRSLFLVLRFREISYLSAFPETNKCLIFALSGLGVGGFMGGYFFQNVLMKGMVFVTPFKYMKLFVILFLFSGFVSSLYAFESRVLTENWISQLKLLLRFRSGMFFLPLLTGNALASRFMTASCSLVQVVEVFWVNNVFWEKGFGKAFRYMGASARQSSSYHLSDIGFSIVLISLIVVMMYVKMYLAMMCLL
uniref:NADH dehydrogenase subunit 5 n=1 Tax=Mactra alta TaxID=1131947 RepID=UPI00286BAF4A|nr:NADH dehydrogenase subunit 5 [Mactra alta]WLS55681.1 NADH dehydrogenase subunit 5 [Mactra alta]